MLASFTNTKIYLALLAIMAIGACATNQGDTEKNKPIDNPFAESRWKETEEKSNITLRTRRGDQMVEVELPHAYGSDLEVPMNPKFLGAENKRSVNGVDYSYSEMKPTVGDREIASTFGSTGSEEDARRKREIEMTLGLQENEELPQMDQSYLAKIDVVKQLFRGARYEAALIEIDSMIKEYPTNPKLYEMRGTVLDRMGYKDLALRSWKQALEFNPNQLALKKVVDRREMQRAVASEKSEAK